MKTHRCIDCPQQDEHEQEELCPSCGRCVKHCHGRDLASPLPFSTDHFRMRRVGEENN